MEPGVELGLELNLGPQGPMHRVASPRQRMRFKHASRPLLVQLAENWVTVNALAPYPGWDALSREMLNVWGQARDVLNPAEITRLRLRYINRIERETAEDRPLDWLRAGEYLPPGVLESLPGFLLRVERRFDVANRVIGTLGDEIPGHEGPGAIIFDIDRIAERGLAPDDDSLVQEMIRLHNDVWNIFSSAKTSRLERLLQGG